MIILLLHYKGYWAISDRVMLVKLRENLIDVSIIKAYALTGDATNDDMEDIYDKLDLARKEGISLDIV